MTHEMVRITIEIVPLGFEPMKRTLGTLHIANDGSGSLTRGNYNTKFYSKSGRVFKKGRVENFPRKGKSVWELIRRALEEKT